MEKVSEEFTEGVYHEEKVLTGGLREEIKYWVRREDEAYVLEYLKLDGASTGMESERLSAEEFEKRFHKTPEPEPEEERSPEEKKQDKIVRQGEIHLEKEEFHSAEYEFQNALKLDENNVKANFGLGKSYSGQGKIEEAKAVFTQLGENEELYKTKNKHTFNELGIMLRKEEMYEDAIKNYHRAIGLDAEDPILHYNLALALYHLKRPGEAREHLETSLGLDVGFDDALKLLELIEKKA